MPAQWLIHPITKDQLSFDEAPAILERDGIMPSYSVAAIVAELRDKPPSFNVRPSDLNPSMECRRQRVWMETHDYGVDPLGEEDMAEGSMWHDSLGTAEMLVPKDGSRLEVCGVPMRGKIDWLIGDRIDDLKNTKPFWIARFATKEQKAADPTLRPWADIWEPKDETSDIEKWQFQLSAYAILKAKEDGGVPVRMGRVWRRYGGVKGETGKRYKRYDFPLLTEEQLDSKIGPWMRELRDGLAAAKTNPEEWRSMPADGRKIIGSKGLWKCERCPCRKPCDATDASWEIF